MRLNPYLQHLHFTLCIAIMILACNRTEPYSKMHTSEVKSVVFNDDHNSEGFLAPLSDGNIMLIFRLDPGMEGNHTGTGGYIARTIYYPDRDRWGEVATIYKSNIYDDRNIHGGVTSDGRIVIFFRHYYPGQPGRYTEGRYFMYSDDDGNTWSDPLKSSSWSDPQVEYPQLGVWGTGQMFLNKDNGLYTMLGYGRHHTYITYSRDGSEWEKINTVVEDPDIALTEIAGAWVRNNRLVALIRDDERAHGYPLLQVTSNDNGATWSDPAATNIPYERHWGCAPQLIYDDRRDIVIAITSDRYSREYDEQSLFIYTAKPDKIFNNPENWKPEAEITRPWAESSYQDIRPLNKSFYGYPTIAPVGENEYLVVFTERATMEGTEQADIYYLILTLE